MATLFDRDARDHATGRRCGRWCRVAHEHGMAATWAAVARASAELLAAARLYAARDDAPPELAALLEQEREALRRHLLALARRHRSP
jgi:FAD/FMN-containing dehydrogenase